MLHIQSFTFNPFQENTYLISNEDKECWIVDPGMMDHKERDTIYTHINNHQLTPQSIINTHTHIDHILGVDDLKQKYQIPFGIHKLEDQVLENAKGSAMLFGIPFGAAPSVDFYIAEEKDLVLGKDKLEVRFTPGHSPGSISFYYAPGKWVIGGDVIFQNSIGRTDLPGGNFDTLAKSIIDQIYTLPEDTIIYSGHGPSTIVGHEKQHNPFVRI